MSFLSALKELEPQWFEPNAQGEVEHIRIADDLLVDVLFAANGHDYDAMQPFISTLTLEGIHVRSLNIDGLLKTKTDYREKYLVVVTKELMSVD